jgi:predicted amidohydrolase YtcJ
MRSFIGSMVRIGSLGPPLVATVLAGCAGGRDREGEATLVVRHARVWTADSTRPRAEAFAVRADRIIWVGDDTAAARFIGPATEVIDAAGAFVMPGFIDAHVHPVSGGQLLAECDLSEVTSLDSVRARVAGCGRRTPPGRWVRGGGYQQPVFPDGRPTRWLLDSLVPESPALLSSSDGHTTWANSRALALAGITRDTPDPDGGRIERDARGEPMGTLRERASRLVREKIPPATEAELDDGLARALVLAARYGITTLYEANANEAFLATYARADSARRLTARIVVALQTSPVEGPGQVARLVAWRERYRRPLVQPVAAKIFADGVIEGGTAAMLEPYVDTRDDRGILTMAPEALGALVQALDSAGFTVHVHAIGDRGVRVALDAFEAVRRRGGGTGPRHQMVHLQLIDPADLPRFRALGVVASYQALWHQRDNYVRDLTEPRLGPVRSARQYAMQSVWRTGAIVTGGSDWSVSSLEPLQAIETGVTRRAPGDTVSPSWIPAEAMTVEQMLLAYTRNAAYAIGREQELGVIRAGALADFIQLGEDPFAVRPSRIARVKVLGTWMGGRRVSPP